MAPAHALCVLLPLAHGRELVIHPEYPGHRIALRRHDGASIQYEGGINLAACEIAELRQALDKLAT